MRVGIQSGRCGEGKDMLLQFANLCRDREFEDGYVRAPEIGVTTENQLKDEMAKIKNRSIQFQNGYYIGTCFKNRSSRLHKVGNRFLKVGERIDQREDRKNLSYQNKDKEEEEDE